MPSISLQSLNDFDEWRRAARALLQAGIAPHDVMWRDPSTGVSLFDDPLPTAAGQHPVGAVPPGFIDLAQTAINNADPQRFALLYRVLWRLMAERNILGVASDPDIAKLTRLASAVRRDSHKMKAFVRFKAVGSADEMEQFAAWFEPDHYTLEMTAPFFARRFDGMHWGIVTPYRSVFWNGKSLTFGAGGAKSDVPEDDAVEDDWRTYFSSIFNPARLKVAMMKSEMPVKYWHNLPEAELIAPLVRGARDAEQQMIERVASLPPSRHVKHSRRETAVRPDDKTISTLAEARSAVQACRRCPLGEHATQAVFGNGPERAEIMFVGEQPGDQEDLSGMAFVGPAGQVLDAALNKVGIDRTRVYVTNAVKHFKFVPRGKRRIHQRPNMGEVHSCKFWLDIELAQVQPKVVVALGATAAQAILGRAVAIEEARGLPLSMSNGMMAFVTNHPAYLLRIQDAMSQREQQQKFEKDLSSVKAIMEALPAS